MDTLHFRESEFKCSCCGGGKPSQHLLAVLELIRNHFNKRIFISSGFRCISHNSAVGGATNSQHLYGMAADIEVEDTNPKLVYEYINSVFPNTYGLGSYETFTHIDVRKVRARW